MVVEADDAPQKGAQVLKEQWKKALPGLTVNRVVEPKKQRVEDLQNGNFVILEINGANSEATHIYDPSFNLVKAYKEVIRHLNYQHKISVQNHQLGVKWTDWKLLARELLKRGKA